MSSARRTASRAGMVLGLLLAGTGAALMAGYATLDGLWLVGDSVFPGQSTLATAVGGVRTAASIASRG